MNINHKCHFHPQEKITNFCSNKQCTLPLCCECLPIHIEQHQSKFQQPQLMSFLDAYRQATSEIEEFLSSEQNTLKKQEKAIEEDRENVIKFIEGYYNNLRTSIQQIKGKYHQIEQKLGKLNRGSIKTLIFFYSGDIELQSETVDFQPLIDRLKTSISSTNTKERTQEKEKVKEKPNPVQNISKESNRVKANSIPKTLSNTKVVQAEATAKAIGDPNTKVATDHTIFNSIDEIKVGERNRDKQKRKIFENNLNIKKQERDQSHPKQNSNKYSYNINPNVENQQERDKIETTNFNYQQKSQQIHKPTQYKHQVQSHSEFQHQRNPSVGDIKTQFRDKSQEKEPEQPVSFENRYSNAHNFTGSEQYEQYKKNRDEKVKDKYQYKIYDEKNKEKIDHRVLKASDLNIQPPKKEQTLHNINSNPSPNYISNQKMRSFSQNQIITHHIQEPKPQQNNFDMKKQVLSPDEIRKMLQKRMEERNRILTLKKNQNYPSGHKEYESKGSIINQIYAEHKH